MTDLTIGNETFRVEVEGDATKPALVLSNSLGADLAMWDGQVAALAAHFRVIRYDARGHGGTSAGDTPVSIGRLGRDVLAILDAMGIDTAHFIGLSLGGSVGLWLLINAPERIGRAVLANTAARISTPEAWNARITSVLADGMDGIAAALIERWFSAEFAAREPERVEAVHAMLRRAVPQGYARSCAALRDMDLRAGLGAIGNEVLVVTGRDDPVVSDEAVGDLVDGIDGARHVALAAKHMSNIEAEAAFNEAVVAFLTAPARKTTSPRTKPGARKVAPAKRGGAGRRSNAARSPLKKAPAKRTAKTAARKTATRKTAAKKAEAHRRPATKRTATRRAAPKAAAAKTPAKKSTARKTATARRPTPTAKARGAVAKPPAKPKATKRVAKAAAKKTAVKTTRKLPAARRKTAAKPRRPTGRRKP